jgi:hypothetical protein
MLLSGHADWAANAYRSETLNDGTSDVVSVAHMIGRVSE